MSVEGALRKYLVKPEGKFTLTDRETNDKSLFDGEKEDHDPYLDQLREELKIQQNHMNSDYNPNDVNSMYQGLDFENGDSESVIDKVGVSKTVYDDDLEGEHCRDCCSLGNPVVCASQADRVCCPLEGPVE